MARGDCPCDSPAKPDAAPPCAPLDTGSARHGGLQSPPQTGLAHLGEKLSLTHAGKHSATSALTARAESAMFRYAGSSAATCADGRSRNQAPSIKRRGRAPGAGHQTIK